ncbi:MAG TPA: BfmA/BtgA family mobilization protein [Cyclobacteriaceae bacterium]|nr:BfmA/BtgA family mobilization protein [Cyclobacteriaceae bacterium]
MSEPKTNLKFKLSERDFIAKASKRFDKPMGEFAAQCVVFVHTFKYNPYDLDSGHAQEEFKKLKNQLISFIRKQEADHIIPMSKSMTELRKEVLVMQGAMQNLLVNTAEPEMSETATSPLEPARDTRILDLMKALEEKDRLLSLKTAALAELKRSAVIGKRDVRLQIEPDRFEELTIP